MARKSISTKSKPNPEQTSPAIPPDGRSIPLSWPLTNTAPIIPAPPGTTQEAGIGWYEIQVFQETKGLQLVAFDPDSIEVCRAVFQMMPGNEITFVIPQGNIRISGGMLIERNSSGEIQIQGQINNQEFSICGNEEDPTNIQVSGRLCLDIEELRVLRQWGKISQPLMGLAQATKGADKAKWGCTSCLVLGAGVSVGGGCCVLNPACCAAALIGGATAIENCHGACA